MTTPKTEIKPNIHTLADVSRKAAELTNLSKHIRTQIANHSSSSFKIDVFMNGYHIVASLSLNDDLDNNFAILLADIIDDSIDARKKVYKLECD